MKVVVQKVLNASVVVNKEEVGKINSGLLIATAFNTSIVFFNSFELE